MSSANLMDSASTLEIEPPLIAGGDDASNSRRHQNMATNSTPLGRQGLLPKLNMDWTGLAASTLGVSLMSAGLVAGDLTLSIAGAALGSGGLAIRRGGARRAAANPSTDQGARPLADCAEPARPEGVQGDVPHGDFSSLDAIVEQMLQQERYALLLRQQITASLPPDHIERAVTALQQRMLLISSGPVQAIGWRHYCELVAGCEHAAAAPIDAVHVRAAYIDRCAVSNWQYYQFVANGGYLDESLWEPLIWPTVREFVDAVGTPGPRFWSHGRFPSGQEQHPVVGVNWYEASAYARWVGKRLPNDAEWIKAGVCPLMLPDGTRRERIFPWGNAMDRSRANLWGSVAGGTVPVDGFPQGASAGGVLQLIGNVWEWTSDWHDGQAFAGGLTDAAGQISFRSLRGGAFDTYFDLQATCQFQSGDDALSRKPNIGFRCALGVDDLMDSQAQARAAENVDNQPLPMEIDS